MANGFNNFRFIDYGTSFLFHFDLYVYVDRHTDENGLWYETATYGSAISLTPGSYSDIHPAFFHENASPYDSDAYDIPMLADGTYTLSVETAGGCRSR